MVVKAGEASVRLSRIWGTAASERHAHLLPDSFREAEFATLKTDLASGAGLVHIDAEKANEGALGYDVVTHQQAQAKQLQGPVAQVDRAAVS